MKSQFAKLINVKTIVTFIITGVFSFLAIKGTIEPAAVVSLVGTVIAFYFGTQHEKKT